MNTKQLVISAAMAGILSAGSVALANEKVKTGVLGTCSQDNDCHGHGGCKTEKNECGGKNSCKHHTFKSTKEACDKVKGKWKKA